MTRINISITNEKTIERLQKLSEKMEVSYATLVAIMSQEYEKQLKELPRLKALDRQTEPARIAMGRGMPKMASQRADTVMAKE